MRGEAGCGYGEAVRAGCKVAAVDAINRVEGWQRGAACAYDADCLPALGTELIRHVSRLLHTPLMALTNAISSVSIVAALVVLSETNDELVIALASVGIALVVTNIVSGFMLTERILRLFRSRKDQK